MLESDSVLALTFAVDLFISQMPDQPGDCVAVFDGPGEPANPTYTYERPHVQIVVRGPMGSYRATHIRAQDIRNSLNGRYEETWGGVRYIGIWALGDIIPLSEDETGRPRFSMNFRLHRTG